ncbi:MAG: polyphosphate:AMP phosphotransferase [Gammaproteobacteria bacterium]|nr:polyphosphate:AMP phosphotransferase [Gammaproteobacteria bacterium]MDH5275656.1 polyphosphate:AMP phosphotransferase [Gammaproteobacteria bacterium]
MSNVGLKERSRSGSGARRRISKKQYAREQERLRVGLVNAQFDLRQVNRSVVMLIAGDDRIGINEVVHLLHEWMDARYLDTRIAFEATSAERQRPPFWRYWNSLPPGGRTGLFVGGWAAEPIRSRLVRELDKDEFEAWLGHAARFEQTLAADGTLILKFWLHLPRKELKRRVAGERDEEEEAWQIQDSDAAILESWRRWIPLADRLLEVTDSPQARWHVIDGTQDRSRNLAVARIILDGLRRFLARRAGPRTAGRRRPAAFPDALARVDLAARFSNDKAYELALEKQQGGLARLGRRAREEGLSSVVVFEGWDAAGKGGVIRRITRALDVRDYHVVPVAAPGPEELAHHYLWRFWRQLPAAGQMTIFDRSWYGRVLVERVEGLARPDQWQRAYAEIIEFENQLLEHGTVLLKFWLHIDADEQLERFAAREMTPYKKYRIGADDYRNRGRRADYVTAANEMIARTSTSGAPWRLIPANDKRYARVAVLRALRDALQTACKAFVDLSPGRG